MVFPGGIADKLGNRYEAKWLVRQFFDVIGGRAEWLCFEKIGSDFAGFEFALKRRGITEWHQTKISSPNGNWTIAALNRDRVLSALKRRLEANDHDWCVFVSQDPAKDIQTLVQKATIASNRLEFEQNLGRAQVDHLNQLLSVWKVGGNTAFSWLGRCQFLTMPDREIESVIETLSDLYFLGTPNAFPLIRDFLESRINKPVTTEIARHELPSERNLILKDWSLVPTLRQKLDQDTAAYLTTYSPFGLAGTIILRPQVRTVLDLIESAGGPQVIIVTGIAGSGKSGIVRGVIDGLKQHNVAHLAVRIDHHLDCASPQALGLEILGRQESPASTLKGLEPERTSVLIVDQVDAVSEVSGRRGAVKEAVLRLVDDVRNLKTVVLILVCRSFDLDSDPRLKSLKAAQGVQSVGVPPLSWEEEVRPIIIARGFNVEQFSASQRDLLSSPLNLSIFLECAQSDEEVNFASRNELFERLLQIKDRTLREERSIPWGIILPLSALAKWMSEKQKLDAPSDALASFGGALDLLTSEGLIIRSRDRINFFHESFFDFVYAREFANEGRSLADFLASTEQHLFRRTQSRQILETLRQSDIARYHRELEGVLTNSSIRYHVKVALCRWLGSLNNPNDIELRVVLRLDDDPGSIQPLVRYSILSSSGWFDLLGKNGWLEKQLLSEHPKRQDAVLWWLPQVAVERPVQVANLLDNWWKGNPERGEKLLQWFNYLQTKNPAKELIELYIRVIRARPATLFEGEAPGRREMLFGTVATWRSYGAAVLQDIFNAWFEAHPNRHPFERNEWRDMDLHHLGEMAKNTPEDFIEGSIEAVSRAITIVADRERAGERDYSFTHRAYSGHRFGADAFIAFLRSSLVEIAKRNPEKARQFLGQLDPRQHEVLTHLHLEAIASNGQALAPALIAILDSPHLFTAGWEGAPWKSIADAAKAALPYLDSAQRAQVEKRIEEYQPEIRIAVETARGFGERANDERALSFVRMVVTAKLNTSGHVQWCIFESIGEGLLTSVTRRRLTMLRRKFVGQRIPEPSHREALFVRSPINSDKAARMKDAQWLSAMKRYNREDERRYERMFVEGGPRELGAQLQRLAKEQPERFGRLIAKIPIDSHEAYVSGIMWRLAEAGDVDEVLLRSVIIDAHSRPGRRFGNDIVRLFSKYPLLARENELFDILIWYIDHGEANERADIDVAAARREAMRIEDLVSRGDEIHIREINSARGSAAEALANVLWNIPERASEGWSVVERRISVERLVSVRCCLMTVLVPLFNQDRQRCAGLVESLIRGPSTCLHPETVLGAYLLGYFPPAGLPLRLRRLVTKTALFWRGRRNRRGPVTAGDGLPEGTTGRFWLLPLTTRDGTHLLPFLVHWVPQSGKRLIYYLMSSDDENAQVIGTWHVIRRSFQDAEFAPLADELVESQVENRRLAAGLASQAIVHDEFRARAERQLGMFFDDDDQDVRRQAASVFRNISSDEFGRFGALAADYLNARAFKDRSFEFFHALEEAASDVGELVITSAEKLIFDLDRDEDRGGARQTDFYQLQGLLKREYAASEGNESLRKRILDVIDEMLRREVYGVDEIIRPHER